MTPEDITYLQQHVGDLKASNMSVRCWLVGQALAGGRTVEEALSSATRVLQVFGHDIARREDEKAAESRRQYEAHQKQLNTRRESHG